MKRASHRSAVVWFAFCRVMFQSYCPSCRALRSWLAALLVAVVTVPTDAGDYSLLIEVQAGQHDRENTPVVFKLPNSLPQSPHFRLTRLGDQVAIDSQRLTGDGHDQLVWLIRKPLAAGQSRRYRLEPVTKLQGQSATEDVRCDDDGQHLLIHIGEKPVIQYNHGLIQPPSGMRAHFGRSGYIHPLFNPAGQETTGDFPPDHKHQHAIFFAWVNTTFDGRDVDFWNQATGTGRIEHASFSRPCDSGPVFAQFAAELRHCDINDPDNVVPALEENWTVRVYNLTDYFLVDIESRQRCACDVPLTINQFHYGGMAIRGNQQWFEPRTAGKAQELVDTAAGPARPQLPRDYLTSEGKTLVDGNGTRARWAEMHGRIDGQLTGVNVMCHPGNFQAPQPVRLHPSKPYFCFAPMVLGTFQIRPGADYVSRYRYYVHMGPPDSATSNRLWNDYAAPPTASVVSETP